MTRWSILAVALVATALSGCDLAPGYVRPPPAVPVAWPSGPAYPAPAPTSAPLPAAAAGGGSAVIVDPKLRRVIALALSENRDLRSALANVAVARATYKVQRAYQFPTVAAGVGADYFGGITGAAAGANGVDAEIGLSGFEIDLFGRLRNLSKEAFENYLATVDGLRSTRLTIVTQTALAYATLAADSDLLRIVGETRASGQRSLDLTRSLFGVGLVGGLDVQNAEKIVEQAASDQAAQTTLVAQDRNALDLLVGRPVPDALLPKSLADLDKGVAAVPAGLPATVLLDRPDVQAAEHQLLGAYADIGAARAAFFPTINLTGAFGLASSSLSRLVTGGVLGYSTSTPATVSVFGGNARGNLDRARARRDLDVVTYQKTLQTAFREVANALARLGTIRQQRDAQERLMASSSTAYDLANTQYGAGIGGYLDVLTAQRDLYAARRSRLQTVMVDIAARLSLYNATASDLERFPPGTAD